MGVKASHRKALLRNLALSLIHHERIQTTLPKVSAGIYVCACVIVFCSLSFLLCLIFQPAYSTLSMYTTLLWPLIRGEQAKGMRSFVEKLITLGKKGTNHHKRMARKHMYEDGKALNKLFNVLGPRYADRQGGYTRILKIGHRQGDRADMALIELVDRVGEVRKARPAKKTSSMAEFSEEDLKMGMFYPQAVTTSMGLGQGGKVVPIDNSEEGAADDDLDTPSESDGEGIETNGEKQ